MVFGVVLAAGGLGWAYATGHIGQDHRATLPPEEPQSTDRQAFMVTAEPVTIRSVKRSIDAVGTLYGFEEIVVSSKVEGRVLRVHHDVSDRIAPGELLIEIDPTDLQLSAAQSESNLQVELAKLGLVKPVGAEFELAQIPTVRLAEEKRELARLKMDRVRNLDSRQATTKEAVDNAMSEYRMTVAEFENQLMIAKSGVATIASRQAALSIAQQQLSDTQVKAPIPRQSAPSEMQENCYVMTKRSIAEGTFLRVGDEIGRLVIDGTLKLRLSVPERHSHAIELGQNVDVFIAARAEPFLGKVTMISPAVDTATRTFQVEVQVKNDHAALKPGGFAKGVIEVSRDDHACTVPLSAMVRYAGVIKLFTIEQGFAKEVQFRPGVQTAEWVEVADPKLADEAIVITSGQFSLSTGSPVTVRQGPTDTDSVPAGEPEMPQTPAEP